MHTQTHTRTHAPSVPTPTCHTRAAHTSSDLVSPTHSPTHSGASTPFRILRTSHSFPSTSCHLHTDPHVLKSRGSHTHIYAHLLASHIWEKKKKATGANMHVCYLHRRHATRMPACTRMYTHMHVNPCPDSGILSPIFSRLEDPDFENVVCP